MTEPAKESPSDEEAKAAQHRTHHRILVALAAILGGLMLACVLLGVQISKDATRLEQLRDVAVHPPTSAAAVIGGPFTLIDQDGKSVTDADFRGKYLLIYFGYTYCPDMCPTGLTSIAHALDQFGPDADKVQPIFITVDPARDTPAKLKEYVTSFHPKIIGLTGSAPQIAAVAREYQVYYAPAEKVDEDNYMMDHTTLIYVMGPDGRFLTTLPEEVDPKTLANELRGMWSGAGQPKP